MSYLVVFIIAMGGSLLLTPVAQQLGHRWGMVAVPGGRRQHKGLIPTSGGMAIGGAWLLAVVVIYWLMPPVGDDARRLQGVVLGTIFVFLAGLADDRWELSPWANLGVQLIAAMMAMAHIVFIELFTNPLTGELVWIRPQWFAYGFSLFWMVGMMNAVNFLDGLDGLAAGVGTVAALLFAWHSYQLGQTTVALFPLALAGALLGFLPYNFAPARIFLGAGAYVLGYLLATLSILSPAKIATALLVLAIPILDVAWIVVARMRQGQSPWQGDRRHLHFRLADKGVPTRWIALGYYGLAVGLGLVGVSAVRPWGKLLVLVLLAGALATVLWRLSYEGEKDES
ncbi:MAG TPA: MraY family glycosyltransferase [Anaerolineae bacterium]|nr:MraY family glycosyltransferase [Anaerolineae bacterium]